MTGVGQQLRSDTAGNITKDTLRAVPAYNDYVPRRQNVAVTTTPRGQVDDNSELDPTEQIESGIELLRADVATHLLKRLQERHPDFFEEALVKLLLATGYGGAENRGRRTILIDGKQLTNLMILHSVGVQTSKVYTVVEVDEDFFEQAIFYCCAPPSISNQ